MVGVLMVVMMVVVVMLMGRCGGGEGGDRGHMRGIGGRDGFYGVVNSCGCSYIYQHHHSLPPSASPQPPS